MGGFVESIGGAVVGRILGGKGRDTARDLAGGIVPTKVRTPFSMLNTETGQVSLDPSIRAGQNEFISRIRGMRDPINTAFNTFGTELGGIRGEVRNMISDFEGNQSAFREATLNPLRQRIAARGGELRRNLARTDVRGSFADQSVSNFELDAGRTLTDAEASVENQRINNLGNLLGMDADLLKQGLASETGRLSMLANLEESLLNVSNTRFQQEMAQLGLPASFIPGNAARAGMLANAEGRVAALDSELLGSVLEGIGNIRNETTPPYIPPPGPHV